MDRVIVYAGAIPQDTDILKSERNAMNGLAKLAHAILGDGPFLNQLVCAPTSPASMQVQVGPGQIYQLTSMDATAFGSLAADTTHQILKQGILWDAVNLSCPAPGTAGQSINYLIQVAYTDTDGGSAVLPYYNSSNPALAYNGPNNTGVSQNTVRQGVCTVAVKAGTAATTGTQTTPSPDAGYVGAYVVTVANGASTIIAGNISVYAGAPFITNKLTSLAPLASPVFTGTPTAPTPAVGDNSQTLATTAWFTNQLIVSVASRANLVVSATGLDQKVSVTASELVLQSATNVPVVARNVNLTGANAINLGANGANGLDAGTVQPSTWYAVWVLEKADGTQCGVASLSTTLSGVTLPTGYLYGKRVSMCRTDATASPSSKTLPYKQEGNVAHYVATAASNLTALPSYTYGATGALSVVPYIPTAVTSTAIVNFTVVMTVGGQSGTIGPSSQNQSLNIGGVAGTFSLQAQIRCESNSLYVVNNATSTVSFLGWVDNL